MIAPPGQVQLAIIKKEVAVRRGVPHLGMSADFDCPERTGHVGIPTVVLASGGGLSELWAYDRKEGAASFSSDAVEVIDGSAYGI